MSSVTAFECTTRHLRPDGVAPDQIAKHGRLFHRSERRTRTTRERFRAHDEVLTLRGQPRYAWWSLLREVSSPKLPTSGRHRPHGVRFTLPPWQVASTSCRGASPGWRPVAIVWYCRRTGRNRLVRWAFRSTIVASICTCGSAERAPRSASIRATFRRWSSNAAAGLNSSRRAARSGFPTV